MIHMLPVGYVAILSVVFFLSVQLSGTLSLHRVLNGRYSYWPLVSSLLLYNFDFFYGFLSYLAGVGLALLFLAFWIAYRDRSALLRTAAGSVAAMLLFLAHIIPFIVYAAAVAGYELRRRSPSDTNLAWR